MGSSKPPRPVWRESPWSPQSATPACRVQSWSGSAWTSQSQPTRQPINRPTDRPINRPTGQPINRPTGQPTRRSPARSWRRSSRRRWPLAASRSSPAPVLILARRSPSSSAARSWPRSKPTPTAGCRMSSRCRRI
ncbi:MAG: PT domain-containing protein [Bifidobacteriaceae bacterium]|nr:PT domain-containing protein [Bifidobacteriaceae bacterium]